MSQAVSHTNISISGEYNSHHAYMLLGRLKMDLEYYFGCGNKEPKHLYYDTIDEHMGEVKKLLASFAEVLKPVWFTDNDVRFYESLIADDSE
jgi:hypothetical protein